MSAQGRACLDDQDLPLSQATPDDPCAETSLGT